MFLLKPTGDKPRAKSTLLEIDGMQMELRRKKMKYLRVAVKPPYGEVKVSAPMRASRVEIESFVRAHLGWIREQQTKLKQQPLPKLPQFDNGDSHYIFGREVKLEIVKATRYIQTYLDEASSTLRLAVKENTLEYRKAALQKYHRQLLQRYIPELVVKYEPRLGVVVDEWRIKSMKTRWGTCNITDKRIWLNLTLAHYPFHCLEYVVVHEMAHLLERHHNDRFWRLVSQVMPEWQKAKIILKQNQFG